MEVSDRGGLSRRVQRCWVIASPVPRDAGNTCAPTLAETPHPTGLSAGHPPHAAQLRCAWGRDKKALCRRHFFTHDRQLICPTGKSLAFANACPAPARKIFFFRFSEKCGFLSPSCLAKRGGSRSSRTSGGMRWTRAARQTSALLADGEAVWFWRPEAGVKFAGRQRVARMTGSTKQLVPGKSAE